MSALLTLPNYKALEYERNFGIQLYSAIYIVYRKLHMHYKVLTVDES